MINEQEQAILENEKILEGIVDVLECADDIEELYLHGSHPGVSTGFTNLDPFYRVKKGQWTVITGIPGSGKSTLVDNFMVSLSEQFGWKHLVCSPENQPISRHIASLVSIHSKKSFSQQYLPQEEYIQSLQFIQEHFRFIHPPEENFTPGYILDLAKIVESQGFGFDGVVIDPWNEMEHRRPASLSETEYVSYALSRFRRYARDYDKHLWLVAHPTKLRKLDLKITSVEESAKAQFPVVTLYDISGSAHFYNKCDNGLSVWRDKFSGDNKTKIFVQKIRFRECGSLGESELLFNWQSGRFENA